MATWTGTIPDLLAGDIPSAGDWQQIRDAIRAIALPWSTYATVWSSTGTQPAIGNGTIASEYWLLGKTFYNYGSITMGSTTTYGTGSWLISLPVSLLTTATIGHLYVRDSSTATNDKAGAVLGASATTMALHVGGNVTATNPFTWATGDSLRWSILGETA
jgi:hypothetical protein